ncbi:MAG: PPC domain-containing protein [Solirubrobacterales bacterium]
MRTHLIRFPMTRAVSAVVVSLLALALTACGSGGGGGGAPPLGPGDKVGTCASAGGPPVTIQGRITYERLRLSLLGLGPATEIRAARHIDVELRSATSGACYGRTSTDANGDYQLIVLPAAGESVELAVFSRTLEAADHDILVHNALPPFAPPHSETNVFSHVSSAFAAASTTVDLLVPYRISQTDRPGAGFGLLDTLVTCSDRLAATGVSPNETVHAYTRVGNNGLLGTSYYSHTSRSLAILGGASGLEDDSDTDYFDDAVVAHEFMHFVDKHISHNMSRGGAHSGELLEPGFAWSEGMATGFGCLLMRSPHYMDSSKTDATEPNSIRFYTNAENATAYDPPGIGGEFTVAEVVWDCADTDVGLDTDGDGVDTAFGDLVRAIDSFDPATDGPYIGLFLTRLVALSATISTPALSAMLASGPEDQEISFPPTGDDVWPKPITVGGPVANGTVSSLVPNPCRGLEASHWYQFTLISPAVVRIDLRITGIGGSGDNLDLYLFTNNEVNFAIAGSNSFGNSDESITASLTAGTYIVRVEASCLSSHNAAYELEIQ